MLCSVSADGFRRLSFKEQLEIVSHDLFSDNEVVPTLKPKVALFDRLPGADLPPIVPSLPVSFVPHKWAAYACSFSPKWYDCIGKNMCVPLDDYGVQWERCASVHGFDFPMMSLSTSMHHLFNWVVRNKHTVASMDALMAACRMSIWIDIALRRPEFSDLFRRWSMARKIDRKVPHTIYADAQREFSGLYDYDEINGHCPTIETCKELAYLEFDDCALHPFGRVNDGRWYHPLIPTGLYAADRFRISNWGWLDT